ncbi:menaquinone biosynthesis protein [Flavobacteriales bacterium]|nr:menaquinone biosynthesis protein [Flavobacteriales bacterium]
MKVCSVSYLNSIPFVYGLENSTLDIHLSTAIPSECASKLLKKEVDIALVPVAVIPEMDYSKIISSFCISCDGPVQTVCLFSDCPLDEIDTIYLDYHSKTSNALVQILCREYWKITPKFIDSEHNFEEKIGGRTAGVIIGDRANAYRDSYDHIYDLCGEWKKYTSLPFVFACWVSNSPLNEEKELSFSNALAFGIDNLEEAIKSKSHLFDTKIDKTNYLTKVINYHLDDDKRKSMQLFFKLLK